jgi:proliferating cell nuclear antigen PCNA
LDKISEKPIEFWNSIIGFDSMEQPQKNANRILEVKTYQTGAFKQVIECINNVVSEVCITFVSPDNEYTPEKEEPADEEAEVQSNKKAGIQILKLTDDKEILIKVVLPADNFQTFICLEPEITIGVVVKELRSVLRHIDSNDPITLYMDRDNCHTLYIHSIYESEDGTEIKETNLQLRLIDIANLHIQLPKVMFENKITIATDKFRALCNNFNKIGSEDVKITALNNQISFMGKSDLGDMTITFKDFNPGRNDDQNQIICGTWKLPYLAHFSKCDKLCSVIDIYLKRDFPLVLLISVGSLGKMFVFLSPSANEEMGS